MSSVLLDYMGEDFIGFADGRLYLMSPDAGFGLTPCAHVAPARNRSGSGACRGRVGVQFGSRGVDAPGRLGSGELACGSYESWPLQRRHNRPVPRTATCKPLAVGLLWRKGLRAAGRNRRIGAQPGASDCTGRSVIRIHRNLQLVVRASKGGIPRGIRGDTRCLLTGMTSTTHVMNQKRGTTPGITPTNER